VLGLDAEGADVPAGPAFGRLAPGHVADAVAWRHDWTVARVWAAGRELPAG